MRPTVVTINKIISLLKNEVFWKRPFRTLFRIASWEYFRLMNKTVDLIFDNDIKVIASCNDGAGRLLYYFDEYDKIILKLLDNYIKDDMVIVDIGSNIGFYTLFAAKRINTGKVIAFEPSPDTFKRLQNNILINNFKNIVANDYAVGKHEGIAELTMCEDSAKCYIEKLNTTSKNHMEKVKVISLDKYISIHSIPKINYLKVDVEGYELDVLMGGIKLLRHNPPELIQLELYNEFLARNKCTVQNVIDFINPLNYRCYKIVNDSLVNVIDKEAIRGDVFLIHKDNLHIHGLN